MPAPGLALAAIEQVALETIRQDRPETLATSAAWLTEVLNDLVRTSQGRVVTEAEANDLLLRLRDEAVARMRADMQPWGEDEDLRGRVVDLLARHLLAEARHVFMQRVVGATRN